MLCIFSTCSLLLCKPLLNLNSSPGIRVAYDSLIMCILQRADMQPRAPPPPPQVEEPLLKEMLMAYMCQSDAKEEKVPTNDITTKEPIIVRQGHTEPTQLMGLLDVYSLATNQLVVNVGRKVIAFQARCREAKVANTNNKPTVAPSANDPRHASALANDNVATSDDVIEGPPVPPLST
ncbi:hypothetical protein ACFE04_001264 [Oxalis oulophora]